MSALLLAGVCAGSSPLDAHLSALESALSSRGGDSFRAALPCAHRTSARGFVRRRSFWLKTCTFAKATDGGGCYPVTESSLYEKTILNVQISKSFRFPKALPTSLIPFYQASADRVPTAIRAMGERLDPVNGPAYYNPDKSFTLAGGANPYICVATNEPDIAAYERNINHKYETRFACDTCKRVGTRNDYKFQCKGCATKPVYDCTASDSTC